MCQIAESTMISSENGGESAQQAHVVGLVFRCAPKQFQIWVLYAREKVNSLQRVQYFIDEYQRLYRNVNLPPFVRGKIYSLYNRERSSVVKSELFWPETWPLCDRYGVYAIFSDEILLYIGKASLAPLGYRLGSYFRYSEDKQSGVPKKGHVWTRVPTHVVTWAVPTESFFEASALEEYLIFNLGELLLDNALGKHI